VADAVHNASVLEFLARLAGETIRLRADAPVMQDELRDKHFFRKHGPSAYYGQTKRKK
jgi:L-ribulose-5-phosphate 4-epimerase